MPLTAYQNLNFEDMEKANLEQETKFWKEEAKFWKEETEYWKGKTIYWLDRYLGIEEGHNSKETAPDEEGGKGKIVPLYK